MNKPSWWETKPVTDRPGQFVTVAGNLCRDKICHVVKILIGSWGRSWMTLTGFPASMNPIGRMKSGDKPSKATPRDMSWIAYHEISEMDIRSSCEQHVPTYSVHLLRKCRSCSRSTCVDLLHSKYAWYIKCEHLSISTSTCRSEGVKRPSHESDMLFILLVVLLADDVAGKES